MKLLFRDVRAKKRKALLMDINSIARKEIEDTLDKLVKPALIGAFEAVVENWDSESKPTFQARKTIKPDVISIYVFPVGTEKQKMIWSVVDEGSKKRIILAKRSPYLTFRVPYLPKTKPRAKIVSGGGRYGNRWIKVKSVTHEVKPRFFSVSIADDAKPDFKREIENAFRRTADKVSE